MLNHPDTAFSLMYLLAAVPYAWLGLYAWRKRPAIAVTSFALVMLGVSIWSAMYALEIYALTLPVKLFFIQVEYIGIIIVPVAMLLFALEFTGRSHLIKRLRARALIWLVPCLTIVFVWTNEFHHFMWDNEKIVFIEGLYLFQSDYRFFFWVHTAYSYGLLIIASIILIMEMIQRPRIYRIQISFVILSIIFPLVGNFFFVTGGGIVKNLDLTPLFFLPTALGLTWAIIRYRLLEVLPLEHVTVLQNMKDNVIVLNGQKRVLYLNPKAEKLLNRKEDDAIGQPLEKISRKYAEHIFPYLAQPESQAEIKVGEGKQVQIYELSVSSIERSSQQAQSNPNDRMIILRDITERKEVEITLARREAIMSSISIAAEQFLKETSVEQNIPEVLKKIGIAAQVGQIVIREFSFDEKKGFHSNVYSEWSSANTQDAYTVTDKDMSNKNNVYIKWGDLLSEGFPVDGLVKNLSKEEQELFNQLGIISYVVVPIFVDTKWWGVISFFEYHYERVWASTEIEAFQVVANIFGAAQTRAQTEQKLIRRQKTLELLQDIVHSSLKMKDIHGLTDLLANRIAELINADGCFITMWDNTNKITKPLAAYSMYREVYLNSKPDIGKLTFTESALNLNKTLVIENAFNSVYVDKSIAEKFPSRSLLVIPLVTSEKKFGAILITFNQYHLFEQEEIRICEQATEIVALALEKFQAVEQAEQRANTSETLRKASIAVTEQLEMEQTISLILEQLNQVVPSDSASVQLIKNNELQIIGGRGWENTEEILKMKFPLLSNHPNSVIIQTGKPYYLPDVSIYGDKYKSLLTYNIYSWLGIPLITQDKIIGLLTLDGTKPNRFTEDDIKVATDFANQVAVALENARIYQESQIQAIIDPLTRIYNRRGLFQIGVEEFEKAFQAGKSFSAIMLDIDHFKSVNDQHGHDIGDIVLREIASYCKKCTREFDFVARYGGEEMTILLPDTDSQSALQIAERLRKFIENSPIQISEKKHLHITASLGVAEKSEFTKNFEALIKRADQALYIAKHNGRNRVAYSH